MGQLPVGSLTYLVEHRTGYAEVMDSNPVQTLIFFRPYFLAQLSSVNYRENRFHIHLTLINATGTKKNSGLLNFCLRNGNIPRNLMTGVEGLNIMTVLNEMKS